MSGQEDQKNKEKVDVVVDDDCPMSLSIIVNGKHLFNPQAVCLAHLMLYPEQNLPELKPNTPPSN